MSCHETEIKDKLQDCKNQNRLAVVETQQSGDFVNIRKFIASVEQRNAHGKEVNPPTVKPEQAFDVTGLSIRKSSEVSSNKPYDKDPVGLAVEVFIALREGVKYDTIENNSTKEGLKMLMDTAIDLVKQARESFK